MRNWNSFLLVSTVILVLILFASEKITFDNMLSGIDTKETLIVSVKTLLVIAVFSTTLAFMVVVILADVLVSLLLIRDFPITHWVYDLIYLQFSRGWYWDAHSGSHIFMAAIILFGLSLISLYIGPVRRRKKKFIYHKKSTR